MGSEAEHWTEIYANTHERRLQESLARARAELVDTYKAKEVYVKYLSETYKLQQEELTKAQKAVLEYDEKRGGRQGASIDDDAKLLSVIATAGNTVADAAGAAAQRKFEVEALVTSRYNLSDAQSSAIGKVSDYFSKQVLMSAFKTEADILRSVDTALGQIPDGTFASGADASKTALTQLYSRIDKELSNSSVYAANPDAKHKLRAKLSAKLGVDAKYYENAEVDRDKRIDIEEAKRTVSDTGTDTSLKAAALAEQLLGKNADKIPSSQKEVLDKFLTNYSGDYFDVIKEGGTIEEAKRTVKEQITDETEKERFDDEFEQARLILAEYGDQDIQKFFDPAYVNSYSRAVKLGEELDETTKDFTKTAQELKNIPTEEEIRKRGLEIYKPISPGIGKRTKEAGVQLEDRAATLRIAKIPQTDEDLMASRMLEGSPQLPDEQKILAAASLGAVRALNRGWKPQEKYEAIVGQAGEFEGSMTVDDYKKLGTTPAASLGYRLYSNVKDKQLRDLNPKSLVKYASDLAGGDVALRDEVLQEFYKHITHDMRGVNVQKTQEDVKKFESPKKNDIDKASAKDYDGVF